MKTKLLLTVLLGLFVQSPVLAHSLGTIQNQCVISALKPGYGNHILVYLTCDQTTFAKDEHKAFVYAPTTEVELLSQIYAEQRKAEFVLTHGGYAGKVISIDGKTVESDF